MRSSIILVVLFACVPGSAEDGPLQLRWSVDVAPEFTIEIRARGRAGAWVTFPRFAPEPGSIGARGLDPAQIPESIRRKLGSTLARRLPLLFYLPDEPVSAGEGTLVLPSETPALRDSELLGLEHMGMLRGRVRLRGTFWRGVTLTDERLELRFDPRSGRVVYSQLRSRDTVLSMQLRYAADPERDFAGAVDMAILRGVDALQMELEPWEPPRSNALGVGALSMLALLECGVPADSPVIEAGFARLRELRIDRTYDAAIYLMALEARFVPAEEDALGERGGRPFEVVTRVLPPPAMERAVQATSFLLGVPTSRIKKLPEPRREERGGAVITGEKDIHVAETGVYFYDIKGSGNFLWSYTTGVPCGALRDELVAAALGKKALSVPSGGLNYDHSNTQYGVLGLISARRCGIRIPSEVWETMLLWWALTQGEDGGWGYRHDAGSRYTMTTAGYVALLAARGGHGGSPPPPVRKLMVRALERARAYLDRHVPRQVQSTAQNLYGAYGLERAGSFGAVERFGCDWYREGAMPLLEAQQADGHWSGGYDQRVNTAFALLFLARASTPIVIKKPEAVITGDR